MRRAKWGVGAAAVVGLAWLVSRFFDGGLGGIGVGTGPRVELSSRTPQSVLDDDPSPPPAQGEPRTVPVSAHGPERAIGEGGAVEVLIDGTDYFLRRGAADDGEWVAAEPDAIVGYAREAAGDETGVRVRVFRRPSSLASAEDRLATALRDAGVSNSEIDVPEKLVEQ